MKSNWLFSGCEGVKAKFSFFFFFSVGSEYVNLDKKWKKRQKDVKNIARKGKRVWVWRGVFVYVTINSRSDVRGVTDLQGNKRRRYADNERPLGEYLGHIN